MTRQPDGTDGADGTGTDVDGVEGDAGDVDAGDVDDTDGETREGTFLVTAADGETAVLKDVDSGQVHTLAEDPGLEPDEAIRGVVAPEPPLNVAWRLVEVIERRTLRLSTSAESPTALARDVAADQPVGEVTRRERAGTGELHVLTVPEDGTESAVEDVLADREATLARAARLGVNRVEVRSAPGVVVVRYLP